MTHTIRTHRPVRTTVGALAAAALLTLTACNAGGDDDSKASDDSSASADPSASSSADAAAEPDLDGIPDVVAEVNGEEVTKDEFVPIYEVAFQQAAARPRWAVRPPTRTR